VCADPTTTAAAAHPRLDLPRRLRQLVRHHDSGSHLPPFSPSFFSMHGSMHRTQCTKFAHWHKQEPAAHALTRSSQMHARSSSNHTSKQVSAVHPHTRTNSSCMYAKQARPQQHAHMRTRMCADHHAN
jgi:hypothetical protein